MSKLVRTWDLNLQVQVITVFNKLQEEALRVSARKKERYTERTEPVPNKLGLPVIVVQHIVRQLGSWQQ